MTRERLDATPRRAMTPARRQLVLDAYESRCAEPGCGKVLTIATAEIDHITPLFQGGADTLANTQPLCGPHHRIKTAHDAGPNAKLRRLIKAETEPRAPPKRPIRSRGFDPNRTRRMDGSVVSRESRNAPA